MKYLDNYITAMRCVASKVAAIVRKMAIIEDRLYRVDIRTVASL